MVVVRCDYKRSSHNQEKKGATFNREEVDGRRKETGGM